MLAADKAREMKPDAVLLDVHMPDGSGIEAAEVISRTLPGIARSAFATAWPAKRGPMLLLDSGANVDCKPEWLVQFALMGTAYARKVLGVAAPRVGLLSVGEEEGKGNNLTAAAFGSLVPV